MDAGVYWLGLVLLVLGGSDGRSRLVEPPMRSSLWRYGYSSQINFADDNLNCGGFTRQWKRNGGNCGVCGDPFDATAQNEYGGIYARNPMPIRVYQTGSVLQLAVEVTAGSQGYFEFRLCVLNSSTDRPSQSCFDKHLLPLVDAKMATKYYPGSLGGLHFVKARLPTGLSCNHCLLQWKHHTGYRVGEVQCMACPGGSVSCGRCQGCGEQEQFVNCADIAIYDITSASSPPPLASTLPPTTPSPTTSASSTAAQAQCTCPDPFASTVDPLVNRSKDGINSVNG